MRVFIKWFLYFVFVLFIIGLSLFFGVLVGFKKQSAIRAFIPDSEETIKLPFQYTSNGHIKVLVRIGNKGKYYFILDSGAQSLIIDDFADQINKRLDWLMPSTDSNSSWSLHKMYKVNQIGLTSSLFYKSVRFKKTSRFTDTCDADIKGIVGINVMQGLKWKIDFDEQEIELAKDLGQFTFQRAIDTLKLSKNPWSNHLSVPFSSRNKDKVVYKHLLVDTGFNGTITISKPKKSNYFNDSIIYKGYATSGLSSSSLKETIFFAKEFKVGNSTFQGINVTAAPSSINALGLGFFKQFKSIVLDWENNLLLLERRVGAMDFVNSFLGVGFKFNNEVCYISAALKTDKKNLTEYLDCTVSTINGTAVRNRTDLCDLKLQNLEELNIDLITKEGRRKSITVKREKIF
ncbi:MAG: hypothetical protein AAF717_17815 [Bacteroidota bacterium]